MSEENNPLYKLKGKDNLKTAENVSYLVMILGAILFIFGATVGSYIVGWPVMLGIIGSFLAFGGLVLYILSQFIRLLGE